MKSVFYFLILTIILTSACNNSANKAEKGIPSQMDFKEKNIDLGIIKNGSKKDCSFEFQNTSKVPLIINNVIASCGCTVVKWTKKPIKAGKTDNIEIEFTAAGVGRFRKSISIFSNAKNSPIHLYVTGEMVL
jgi:hypothetical protein